MFKIPSANVLSVLTQERPRRKHIQSAYYLVLAAPVVICAVFGCLLILYLVYTRSDRLGKSFPAKRTAGAPGVDSDVHLDDSLDANNDDTDYAVSTSGFTSDIVESSHIMEHFQSVLAHSAAFCTLHLLMHARVPSRGRIKLKPSSKLPALSDWSDFRRAECLRGSEGTDWADLNLESFFRWTERPDWSAFDISRSLSCAERLRWTGRAPRHCADVSTWATLDVDHFMLWAEKLDASSAPPSDSDNRLAPVVCDASAVAAWLSRKPTSKHAQTKANKPSKSNREATSVRSRCHRRSALRIQSSQDDVLTSAYGITGSAGDENLCDEVYNEATDVHGDAPDACNAFSVSSEGERRLTSTIETSCDGLQHLILPPTTTPLEKGASRPTPIHESALASLEDDQVTIVPSLPKRKPRRRGGRAIYVARKIAAAERHEREMTIADAFLARRHDMLKGKVTHRVSGPWRIPEAPLEAWVSADPPHLAEAFPAPPSGPKPARRLDTLRQKRHGRVKPFICKQQYPTRPVTVLGNDMRLPDAVRNRYREQRKMSIAAMNKRRDQQKLTDAIDHLLVPLRPRLEDVSLELYVLVQESGLAVGQNAPTQATDRTSVPSADPARPQSCAPVASTSPKIRRAEASAGARASTFTL